jgi:hypothetical protein
MLMVVEPIPAFTERLPSHVCCEGKAISMISLEVQTHDVGLAIQHQENIGNTVSHQNQ